MPCYTTGCTADTGYAHQDQTGNGQVMNAGSAGGGASDYYYAYLYG